MSNKLLVVILIGVFGLWSFMAQAAPETKEEAQAEQKKLEKVMKFAKSTVIPLINCYASNQPHLQYLNTEYPEKALDYISKMDYCISKYPDKNADAPKLMDIKNNVINLLRTDIGLGKQLIDAQTSFNRNQNDITTKKVKEKNVKPQQDQLTAQITQLKQDLYKHAAEFQEIQKAFKEFNADMIKRYTEARNRATGR